MDLGQELQNALESAVNSASMEAFAPTIIIVYVHLDLQEPDASMVKC